MEDGSSKKFNFGGPFPETPLPLPGAAARTPIPQEKGYLVRELAPNSDVYFLTNGIYDTMFLVTSDGVILFDAPQTFRAILVPAIAEITDKPVTHMVYTHHHMDHVGAGDVIVSAYPGVSILSSTYAAERIRRTRHPGRPEPTSTFDDTLTLQEGGRTVELSVARSGHVEGNIFAYIPEEKILLIVDVFVPGWVPFRNLEISTDVADYIKVFDDILAFDAHTFVSGHVDRPGSRRDVQTLKEHITELQEAATKAVRSVTSNTEAIGMRTGFENVYLLTSEISRDIAEMCYQELLGGYDVYGRSNCQSMADFVNLEGIA
jgi:glyoxylase-like metal-dependent hydrolase (beta-lactamase superfamily II)